MNDFKVGDKVLLDGIVWDVKEIRMVSVVIEKRYSNGNIIEGVVHFEMLQPYKSAHDKLSEDGWELVATISSIENHAIIYHHKKRLMDLTFEKDSIGQVSWHMRFYDSYNCHGDLKLSQIITQFLEELV